MNRELHELSIRELSSLLNEGRLSVVELTEHYLGRIRTHEKSIAAFSRVNADFALTQAKEAQAEIERGQSRGPLHGIPIAVKDNIDTAGQLTTCNSYVVGDRIPATNATVIDRLRQAGAIELGKATLHEFAFGGPAWDTPNEPARNPWDITRFTGGSSSGSAAAVAAGLAHAALGTDTVGSIRLPAAISGIVGFKPTFDRVPTMGIVPLAYSLDHCGPMAGSVEDCILLFRALETGGNTRNDTAEVDQETSLAGLRVGYVRHFYEEDCVIARDVASVVEETVNIWRRLGATVVDIRLSRLDVYSACCMTIMLSEALAVHEKELLADPMAFGEIVRDRLALASFFTSADYVQAQRLRRQLSAEMAAAFLDVDVIVTAAFPTEAPPLTEVDKFYIMQKPLFTTPFNVTGVPTVCLPAGLSSNGLPLAVQLAAASGEDEKLLAVAARFEQETGFPTQRFARGLPINTMSSLLDEGSAQVNKGGNKQ